MEPLALAARSLVPPCFDLVAGVNVLIDNRLKQIGEFAFELVSTGRTRQTTPDSSDVGVSKQPLFYFTVSTPGVRVLVGSEGGCARATLFYFITLFFFFYFFFYFFLYFFVAAFLHNNKLHIHLL